MTWMLWRLLCVLLLCCALLVHGMDVFVIEGSTPGGSGTFNDPYITMQTAISEMENLAHSESVTLVLLPGIFEGVANMELYLDSMFLSVVSYAEWSGNGIQGDVEFNCEGMNSTHYDVFHLSGTGNFVVTGVNFSYCNTVISYISRDRENSSNHPISVRNCTITGGMADSIVLQGVNYLSVTGTSVNICSGYLVYMVGTSDKLCHGEFSDLEVTSSKGFYLYNIFFSMEFASFYNMLDRAIFFNPVIGSSSTIEYCTFSTPLIAAYQGSSVYVQGITTLKGITSIYFTDCVFYGVSGTQGGAVYLGNINASFGDCTFSYCSSEDGGAIYASGAYIILDASELNNNIAYYGGAVYLSEGSSLELVHNTTFSGNSANEASIIYCATESDTVVVYTQNTELDGGTQCKVTLSGKTSFDFGYSSWYTSEYETDPPEFRTLLGIVLVIAQSLIIGLVLLVIIVAIIWYKNRKKKRSTYEPEEEFVLDTELDVMDYEEEDELDMTSL